jgi:tRNA modification GTPase
MNRLSGRESSIVTSMPGTTRDLVNEFIHLDGVPLKLVDTAGIRKARDEVEEEGVRRALAEIGQADGLLVLVDLTAVDNWEVSARALIEDLPAKNKILVVLNKIDITGQPDIPSDFPFPTVCISAKFGEGISALKSVLKTLFALSVSEEGSFIARARHVDALTRALGHLRVGKAHLASNKAGELMAEELRMCHQSLCEITGEFSSDDLLGRIFSSFCIGK